MADVYGNVVNNWRAWIAAWVTSEDNNGVVIRCVTRFQAVNGWSFSGLNGNYGASIASQTTTASTSGTISVGTNGSMDLVIRDQWIGKSHNNQDIGYGGYLNITGYASGSSSALGVLTINAKPSYTISYNANGGSGQPGNQTKWFDESITLSSVKPTKTNHSFLGWSTSASGSANYQPGQTYTGNSNLTLYAVWKLAYVAPTIDSIDAYRCDDSGTAYNEGIKSKVTVKWHVDTSADSTTVGSTLVIYHRGGTNEEWTSKTITLSTTSGTNELIIDTTDVGKTYTIQAILTDSHNLTARSTTSVGTSFYLIDITEDGNGIGIGTTAPSAGTNIGGSILNFLGDDIRHNNLSVFPEYAIYKRRNFDTGGVWQPIYLAPTLDYWATDDAMDCGMYDAPITSDSSTFGLSSTGKDFIIKKPGTYLITGEQDVLKNGDYNIHIGIKQMNALSDGTLPKTEWKLLESCPPILAFIKGEADNQWRRWRIPITMVKIPTFDVNIDSVYFKPIFSTATGTAASTSLGSRTWIQIIRLPLGV